MTWSHTIRVTLQRARYLELQCVWCSAWDDPEFVEAVLRLVLARLVDSQLGIFAMLNFAISIYAVGALTTKV